jgi:prepilin-type processing-associated H-X9-DG protein
VELLVAIVILGILSALVTPVVQRVKRNGASIKCMSNMLQVTRLILLYAAENNNDLLPSLAYYSPTQGSAYNNWLDKCGYLPVKTYDGLWNGVMTCPSRKTPAGAAFNALHYGMNYAMGPSFANATQMGAPFHKIFEVERPSQTMLLAELNNWYRAVPGEDKIVFPHDGRNNVTFLDGHGESTTGPWKPPKPGNSYPWY